MKKINLLLIMLFLVTTTVFVSCDEDDDPQPAKIETVTVDASGYTNWTYFSFEKGTTVEINDFENSTEWDIGFHRYDVRVNCGEAGPGQGGTYATGLTDFSAVIEAPESGYALNDMIEIAVDITSMPPVYETVPGDTVLATWMIFGHGDQGPTYDYSNEIFVIKTADGKYAKIWLKDYFNDTGSSGHITMKYSYQADGSTNLE